MSSTSDDEILGAEAEHEYESALETEPVETKKPKTPAKRVRLTNSQRLQLIDGFRQGKTDKFYNVIPNKNKPGDYRIVRRRKPLNVPIADNSPEPINMNIEPEPQKEIVKEDKNDKNNKIKQEFFTMQNTINNSLSKEIAAVMEKCNKIEAKMKKQKQKMREQRRREPEPVEEYEYEYEDEEPNYSAQTELYEPQYYSRFNARNRIDLRNFG